VLRQAGAFVALLLKNQFTSCPSFALRLCQRADHLCLLSRILIAKPFFEGRLLGVLAVEFSIRNISAIFKCQRADLLCLLSRILIAKPFFEGRLQGGLRVDFSIGNMAAILNARHRPSLFALADRKVEQILQKPF
jgi:hypothetical protein